MRRWYSPRGARRGALLAILSAMMWLSWAAGYMQGSRQIKSPPASKVTRLAAAEAVRLPLLSS